ncbi:MAG: DUF2085 domain-containing protein [Actinomycetota bacterium]
MVVEHLIEKIGFSVCHQLSDRCLRFGEVLIPVCARCNGIYMGFLTAVLALLVMYRKREAGLAPPWIMAILLLFIASTLADGLLSYLGILSTNNNIRFITGFLCGASIAAIVYPVFVFQYFKASTNRRILSGAGPFILFMAVLAAVISLTLARLEFLGSIFYYLTAFSVVFTFYFLNLAVVLLFPPMAQKADRLFSKNLLLPSLLAVILAGAELYIFYLVRTAAERALL